MLVPSVGQLLLLRAMEVVVHGRAMEWAVVVLL